MTNFLHAFVALLLCSTKECPQESLAVGGQAVMEGVMMRNGSRISLAVRRSDNSIAVVNMRWTKLFYGPWAKKKFLRGFPLLVESLVNGMKSLNLSAKISAAGEGEDLSPLQIAISLCIAAFLAIFIFVLVPHLVSSWLNSLHLSGGLEGASFHMWDGAIKIVLFLGYILLISRIPDIQKVFAYHGAEHKVIAAYESGERPIQVKSAEKQSRLHPRCGTTFLLFVISISILLHILLVPSVLWIWTPQTGIVKHIFVICVKLLLIVPISSIAYELIRFAARHSDTLFGSLLNSPGLFLQLLTTRNPAPDQLEVALVALNEALQGDSQPSIDVPPYTRLDSSYVC